MTLRRRWAGTSAEDEQAPVFTVSVRTIPASLDGPCDERAPHVHGTPLAALLAARYWVKEWNTRCAHLPPLPWRRSAQMMRESAIAPRINLRPLVEAEDGSTGRVS